MAGPKPMLTEFGIHQRLERKYHFNHLFIYQAISLHFFASSSSRGFNKRGESPLAFFTPMPRLTTCWILHFNWCCGVHRRTHIAMRRLSKAHYNCYGKSWKLNAKWRNAEDLIAGSEVFLKVGPMPQTSIGVIKFWGACFISMFLSAFFYRLMEISCYQHQNQDFFRMAHKKNKPM